MLCPLQKLEAYMNNFNNETIEVMPDLDLKIIQSKTGYRFNSDSFFLVDFVVSLLKDKVGVAQNKIIDLGAGSGVLSLLIAKKLNFKQIDAIEIQQSLFDLLKRNIEINNFQSLINPIYGDYTKERILEKTYYYDYIICNPPYKKIGSGYKNINNEKIDARHETKSTMENLIRTINYYLKPKGHAFLVYPSERLAELITALKRNHLEPKTIQIAYHNQAMHSDVFALEIVKDSNLGLKVLPPYFVE